MLYYTTPPYAGVKSMLDSLDPYTEFEDLKAARYMQESVSGKYGGVGLIISNNKPSTPPGVIDENPSNSLIKPRQDYSGSTFSRLIHRNPLLLCFYCHHACSSCGNHHRRHHHRLHRNYHHHHPNHYHVFTSTIIWWSE